MDSNIILSRYFLFGFPIIGILLLVLMPNLISCKVETNAGKASDGISIAEANLTLDSLTVTTFVDVNEADQKNITNTDEKGSILSVSSFKFTDQLIYRYKTNISGYENNYEGVGESEGNIVVYVEPKTNTFLFTKEAYGVSVEMVDFVIADTLGNYIMGYTDEFGKKNRENQFIGYVNLNVERRKFLERDFKKFLKPKNERKVFGRKNFPSPTYDAQTYDMTLMKTRGKSKVFLTSSFLNLRPLYSFNGLDSETKLTYYFDYNNVIPNRFMPVYDKYKATEDGGYSEMDLDSYQQTEYYVDLKKI